MLGLGAWVGPGVVEGGSGTERAIDQPPVDVSHAADRYLTYSLDRDDISPAEAVVCEGSTPDLAPTDLQDIREEYQGEGPRPQVNLEQVNLTDSAPYAFVDYNVGLVFNGRTETLEVQLSILHNGDEFCVVDAEEDSDTSTEGGNGSGGEFDTRSSAVDFVSAIFSRNEVEDAEALLCEAYEGPAPQEVRAFHEERSTDPTSQGARSFGEASSDSVDEVIEVALDVTEGSVTFRFEFIFEDDCIAEITDIPELEDFEAESGADEEDDGEGQDDD